MWIVRFSLQRFKVSWFLRSRSYIPMQEILPGSSTFRRGETCLLMVNNGNFSDMVQVYVLKECRVNPIGLWMFINALMSRK
ncbi:hypothetical protein DL347_20970 [Pseudomonas fluorescens]|uniref:Uncharacterized protein n=1 Tax=Pseudomonas fluorescens TaxID=294 RepID=A0A7Z6MU59_PSEFL|nr:hypothetical protein DL347_20970 [Pseudomonas fluorescens]